MRMFTARKDLDGQTNYGLNFVLHELVYNILHSSLGLFIIMEPTLSPVL